MIRKEYRLKLKNQEELKWIKNYYKDFNTPFIKINEEKLEVCYIYKAESSYYWCSWLKDRGRFYAWRSKNKQVTGVDWSKDRNEMIGERISVLDELKDSTNFESMSDEVFRSLYLVLCQAESIIEKRR